MCGVGGAVWGVAVSVCEAEILFSGARCGYGEDGRCGLSDGGAVRGAAELLIWGGWCGVWVCGR